MKSNEWTVKQTTNGNEYSDSFYESKNRIILYIDIDKEHKGEEENDNNNQTRTEEI